MSKNVWDLLIGALGNLSNDQFRMFTNKLINSPDLKPRVFRCDVDGKDRVDVVGVLVNSFTEKGAIPVTVNVLRWINCNQSADDLEQDAADLAAESQVKQTQSRTLSQPTKATPPTPVSEAEFIDKKWPELVDRAVGMEAILDALLFEKVISDELYNDINAKGTQQNKMRALIRGPINSSGELGKCVLYKILMKQQPFMMRSLGAL